MITYLGNQWLELVEDSDTIIIGLTQEGLDQFQEIKEVRMPELEENVSSNEVCMELYTDEGPFNIYSPVNGQIVEINEAVKEEPDLIQQDNYGDGWIIKITSDEPIDEDELKQIAQDAE